MKKIFIPLFVIATLSITSCRKDRSCTCTVTSTSGSSSTVSTEVKSMGHVTKREATSSCLSRTETSTQTFGNTSYTFVDAYSCKLN
jgi:hypothetical protein